MKVARSFVVKVRRDLEAADGLSTAVAKRKTTAKRRNTIRTPVYETCRELSIRTPESQLTPLLIFQGTLSDELY